MGLHKVIISGNVVETYEYSKVISPFLISKQHAKRDKNKKQISRRKDNQKRVASSFRRIVLANCIFDERVGVSGVGVYFITFTFREFVGLKQGYEKITRFNQRLRYELGSLFSYVIVPEFGSRSTRRLHFHGLYFALPDSCASERTTRYLARLWGEGWLDVVKTDGSPKLASYMAKYVFKALGDKNLFQQKAYVCSRNIKRPVVFTNHSYFNAWGDFKEGWCVQNVLDVVLVDKSLEKVFEYDTLWLGRCFYKRYSKA